MSEAKLRVPQKEVGKRGSISFFCFRDSFTHFLVTFSDASVPFSRHFFARLLLPDSFCGREIRTTPSFTLAMLIANLVGVVRGFRGLKITC